MSVENKKKYFVYGIILLSIAVIGLSGTYAYYIANVLGTGNTTNNQTSVTAVDLGSIYYDGVTIFTSTNLYPGMKAIQEFEIGPNSSTGTGNYEIDLEAVVPEAFGSDITIKLYKTKEKSANNIERTEGVLVQSGNQFYKEDIIVVNGTPELIYEGVLANSSQIILEQTNFDVATLSETTYYLVYDYANNGNQDAQQGLTFSGKVSVRLGFSPPTVKYAVSVYGIEEDTYSLDNGATTQTAGLTFGPATGASFVDDYVSKDHNGSDHSGTTALGNPYRCIHDDDWETIIYWNDTDPYVYQKCQGDVEHLSCTKSVPLYLSSELATTSALEGVYANMSGDGTGMLFSSVVSSYRRMNGTSNFSVYAPTSGGGWPVCKMRATLNGADHLTNTSSEYAGNDLLDESSALISKFPKELKKAIVPKAVNSDTIYNDRVNNTVTTYDKLWLFSGVEIFGDSGSNNDVIRSNEGKLYSRQEVLGITTTSYTRNTTYYESGASFYSWLRSPSNSNNIYYVTSKGMWDDYNVYNNNGFSPGFTLR